MSNKTERVQSMVTPELKDVLEEMAWKNHQTLSSYVASVLHKHHIKQLKQGK